MKQKTTFKKSELIDQLEMILDTSYYQVELPQGVPVETIIRTCAECWGVPESDLKGKINHNNELDKFRKYSVLFGIEWFADDDLNDHDVFNLLGYGNSASRRGCRECMLRLLKYYKYSESIYKLIIAYIELAPKRYQKLIEVAKDRARQTKQRSTEATISVNEYITELRNEIKMYKDLIDKKLLNTEILAEKLKPRHIFNPIWQRNWMEMSFLDDKLKAENRYQFWHEKKFRCGESLTVKGFADNMLTFFESTKN